MSAPVKGRCAEDFLESGVTLPVPVTEPHWYLTVHATQCLLCGRDQYPEERVRIAGERPADPNLRHVYEEGDYACGEHFVVNEYEGVQSDVERIARQLHAQHQDEPVWDKLDGHKRDDYHLFAARVLQCPSVAAAFEAQAKLEALLAGDGDLPEGWTRQYRVVWTDRITPSAAIESAWSDNPDFVEVVREKFKPERIERFEQSIRSTAVRVEEGGES